MYKGRKGGSMEIVELTNIQFDEYAKTHPLTNYCQTSKHNNNKIFDLYSILIRNLIIIHMSLFFIKGIWINRIVIIIL